jgi:hypothetical protein
MDVVYLLGNGSTCGNCEIKYSLRSIEKHLKGFNNIFIVGTRPHFLKDTITEIPFKDVYSNKARNIMAKINRASLDDRISHDFILFNDDYFLLKDTEATNYPYYYKNTIEDAIRCNVGEYEQHCRNTLAILKYNQLPITNFDSHYPIIYNKKKFVDMVAKYDWNLRFGPVVKSMYCNHYKIPGEFLADCKISHPVTIKQLKKLNEPRHMFSTSDRALNVHMHHYFKELYPQKSQWEI